MNCFRGYCEQNKQFFECLKFSSLFWIVLIKVF
nr:MAG TPA: hypothetical protein [Caudoviricetes sp.]